MCRNRFVVTTLAMLGFTGLCLTAAAPAFGEQTPDAAAQMGPLEILNDCLQAAETGDFQRYVDHLAPEEQRFQAASALWMTSTMSQSIAQGTTLEDPNVHLLSRALSDVLQRHRVPLEQRKDEYHSAQQALWELLGVASGGASRVLPPTSMPGQTSAPAPFWQRSPAAVRELCLRAVGMLDDPRQYLIVVLTEVARPVKISGKPPRKVETSFDFAEMVEGFQLLQWTLYTRGDYALAVPEMPQADEPPGQPASPAPADVPPTIGYHEQRLEVALRVEFRRIDNAWKIDSLIRNSYIHPTGGLAAPQLGTPQTSPSMSAFDPYSPQIAR